MGHRIETSTPGTARALTRGELAALAEETAVHAETALAMTGLDDFAAAVEPVPSNHDRRGLRVLFRNGLGDALCVTLLVSPDAAIGIEVAGPAAARAEPRPRRSPGELDAVTRDLAATLREAVLTQFRQ